MKSNKKVKLPSRREKMATMMAIFSLVIAVGAYAVMIVTRDPGASTAAAGVAASAFGALGWVKSRYIDGETNRPSSGTGMEMIDLLGADDEDKD